METHLQRFEVEPRMSGVRPVAAASSFRADHDLAVDHAADGQLLQHSLVELGEVTIQRLELTALDEGVVAAEDNRAETIPLRLEEKRPRLGNGVGQFREHRLDGRLDAGRVDAFRRHFGRKARTASMVSASAAALSGRYAF